jgi:hypothetical protein
MANKAETITEVLLANPGVPSDEIATLVNARGVDTTESYVCLIRSGLVKAGKIPAMPSGRRKAGGSTKVTAAANPPAKAEAVKPKRAEEALTLSDLQAVHELSMQFGGLDRLASAVEALKKLAS